MVSLLPSYSVGYVYLPALAGIIGASVLTATLGVRLAHSFPVDRLQAAVRRAASGGGYPHADQPFLNRRIRINQIVEPNPATEIKKGRPVNDKSTTDLPF